MPGKTVGSGETNMMRHRIGCTAPEHHDLKQQLQRQNSVGWPGGSWTSFTWAHLHSCSYLVAWLWIVFTGTAGKPVFHESNPRFTP